MDVIVAGGHGKIGQRLLRLLAARGDRARGLVRNPDHVADLEALGAEAVLCDLEALDDVASCVEGADAIVYAAGAGPGSGAERKRTMDLGGALKLIDAAKANGIRRYAIVSSINADAPERASGPMGPYLEAKAEADRALVASGLDFTIVRPGGLTDEPGTGRVTLGERLDYAQVTRDDVAATLVAVLDAPHAIGKTFVLVNGETPIDEAIRDL
jgi:uncharacterized protein YbjT (DUF2867 family)